MQALVAGIRVFPSLRVSATGFFLPIALARDRLALEAERDCLVFMTLG